MINIIEKKEHLIESGIIEIKKLRDIQHLNRKKVHSLVIKEVLAQRPDFKQYF